MTNPNEPINPTIENIKRKEKKEFASGVFNEVDVVQTIEHLGLSKREYFAAMAMQGICSGMSNDSIVNNRSSDTQGVAELAVMYADALIEQLNKEK